MKDGGGKIKEGPAISPTWMYLRLNCVLKGNRSYSGWDRLNTDVARGFVIFN